MQSEPSSGIKLTAYSYICWLFHRIYYDARNHEHKIIFTSALGTVIGGNSMTVICCKQFRYIHTLVVGLLARGQYPEGPATGHLGSGFSWFPCVYKRILRWFPKLQDTTACFSCSPPDLNFLDPYFIFMLSLFHIYVHAL